MLKFLTNGWENFDMVSGNIKKCVLEVFNKTFLKPLGIFLIVVFVLWKATYWRISHTYLEDDLVWFFPVIDHFLNERNSWLILLKSFHLPELTLFDALYFAFLKLIFGYNFFLYPLPACLLHLANGVIIYQILSRALNCSLFTSSIAGLIYLTFYGHYHAYLWPMATHHILGVFWILLFIYKYLQTLNKEGSATQDLGGKLGLNLRLYGLAFLASFMRLSVLIVPLIIGIHTVFTSSSRKDFYFKIKRWLPFFLLISWYQILILITGNRADVLSAFLNMENLIALSGLIFVLWSMVRRNLQRIYYFWLIIPFAFILCLYLWLFPQDTLTPSNIALRWQVMPLPSGATMWILTTLSMVIMYTFTRHVIYRNKKFGVFIIWYMLIFPYLLSRLNEMPSRYLVYLSPIFAVVLAVFLGEIISNRLEGFYKSIFRFVVGCSLACFAVINVQAIHERSIRSFAADYHWKYDDIMIAQYIKHDLAIKGDSINKSILCLQGVSRMSYLENWAQKFLKDQEMDGYESLRITLGSLLEIPKERIRINETCESGQITYDFKNDDALSNFRWPANLKKEDAWEIYGNSFDGDSESLRIDNILHRQVNLIDQGKTYWSLKQGRRVERYGGFDIYDFKKWYFAIPQDESFNLARFKMGDYQQTYFANTKYEIRQWIDSKFPYDHHASKAAQGEPRYIPQGEHIFKIKFLGIQLGYLYLRNEGIFLRDGQKLCRISIELKPWIWLQRISGNRIGFKLTSLVTANDLFPVEFEQTDLMKLKKGKLGRKIIYHRDDLFMERRGYKEDIDFDTRDPVATIFWTLSNDYTNQTTYRTTINIERNLFALEVIPVFVENNKTLLKLKVKSLDKKGRNHNWSMILNRGEEDQVPKSIILKVGLANFSITSFH